MPQFQWLPYKTARQALAARLADPNNVFWGDTEIGYYLAESLRTWNALTEMWNADFSFSATNPNVWYDLSTLATSPRLRTVTDSYLYTLMEYHLLEPASGGTWTGTSQFSIADLSGALQRRRDEMIQASGCNIAQLAPLTSTPNSRKTVFTDSTLEPRRARFLPAYPPGSGGVTLTREDTLAFNSFEPEHLQQSGTPQAWSVISQPPLALVVDVAPNVPGTYDVISLQAGANFFPPAPTLINVPDDWSWLAKWGALADLLGRDSEATDRQRADYCLKRFNDGLKIMKASNWILTALLNGIPVDTPSVREMDGYAVEWQDNPSAWPTLVTAGMDFCAPCPVALNNTPVGVQVTLVGNTPIPVLDTDFVQVSRDVFDVVLDYAQVLASFKMGGAEFYQTRDLEKNFFMAAMAQNKRLVKMGVFADLLHSEGKRQDRVQPR